MNTTQDATTLTSICNKLHQQRKDITREWLKDQNAIEGIVIRHKYPSETTLKIKQNSDQVDI